MEVSIEGSMKTGHLLYPLAPPLVTLCACMCIIQYINQLSSLPDAFAFSDFEVDPGPGLFAAILQNVSNYFRAVYVALYFASQILASDNIHVDYMASCIASIRREAPV